MFMKQHRHKYGKYPRRKRGSVLKQVFINSHDCTWGQSCVRFARKRISSKESRLYGVTGRYSTSGYFPASSFTLPLCADGNAGAAPVSAGASSVGNARLPKSGTSRRSDCIGGSMSCACCRLKNSSISLAGVTGSPSLCLDCGMRAHTVKAKIDKFLNTNSHDGKNDDEGGGDSWLLGVFMMERIQEKIAIFHKYVFISGLTSFFSAKRTQKT